MTNEREATQGDAKQGQTTRGTGARFLARSPPRATYRLQFHKGFTFEDATAIVPYLAELGISHVYASPIHKARPGSLHGYDIVDHAVINPELGGEQAFMRFSEALKRQGLGLVLDIVPNHVGVGGSDNRWWLSVLEWGELSPFARAFDIDWERLGANRKLVIPFLSDRYGVTLEKGELALKFDAAEGTFSVWHFEHRFPLSPPSYPIILERALAASEEPDSFAEVMVIGEELRAMGEDNAAERRADFPAAAESLEQRLAQVVATLPGLGEGIERAIALINGVPDVPESFGTLHRLLEAQSYRLADWRVAASDVNYRRFFNINELAGLRVEEPDIFASTHEMVIRLVKQGHVDGLRIDHIDGLADPEAYVEALQSAVGPGFFIVVEKILEPGEKLRPWRVAGTTGYDMLNLIDGVLVDQDARPQFDRIYREAAGVERSYASLLRQSKMEVLRTGFVSELEVLVSDLKRIADSDRHTRDYTLVAIRRALQEIIARFPVYRSYVDGEPASLDDRKLIATAVIGAQRHSELPDHSVHAFIAMALLGTMPTEGPGRPEPELVRRFRRRFQQLSGPVMAKGLEDTLFYRYCPLLALNEVGGDPSRFGIDPEAFHAANAERADAAPHGLTATATHDTKRGEDARARLLVLSEYPQRWTEALRSWHEIAPPHLSRFDEAEAPDANDQTLILQSLLGAWPVELLDGPDAEGELDRFRARMEAYLVKALREAKRYTSWTNINEDYEAAALLLLRRMLDPEGRFLSEFAPLARRLAYLGMLASLTRTALKCTLPGIPDIYQGTELWDLSFVDPDNRRPVDYAARREAALSRASVDQLLASWQDGRIKQRLIASLLNDRAAAPDLYACGDYQPLHAQGPRQGHVLAFRRSKGAAGLIVAVSRLLGDALGSDAASLRDDFWEGTTLPLPEGRWLDVPTGRSIEMRGGNSPMRDLFALLPVAVLRQAP